MDLVTEFRDALALEIDEQKNKGQSRWELRSGAHIEARGPFHVYDFILEDPSFAGAFDDSPVKVRVDKTEASGHIVGMSGAHVFVSVDTYLGEFVAAAHVVAQPYYLLERLSERLRALTGADIALAERCIGRQKPAVGRQIFLPPDRMKELWDSLNEEQKVAVYQALGSDVSYIWGPPGTGKTKTVGVAVAAMVHGGRTVLLTANTNIAVDQALLACLIMLKGSSDYLEGRIVRVGTAQISDVTSDPRVNLDDIVKTRTASIRNELESVRNRLSSVEGELEVLGPLLAGLERRKEIRRSIVECEGSIAEAKRRVDLVARVISSAGQSLARERAQYEKAKQTSGIIRALKGISLARSAETLSKLEQQFAAAARDEDKAVTSSLELERRLRSLVAERDGIDGRFSSLGIRAEELNSTISSRKAVASSLQKKMADLQRQIDEASQGVIRDAVLIAATLTKAWITPEVYGRKFDTVVCDEGSMASIPAVYWSCSLAVKSVTIAGDFRQLAPIASSGDEKVTRWLRRDVFAEAGLEAVACEAAPRSPSAMVMLKTQYRMQPSIRKLVSWLFYGDELRDGVPDEPGWRLLQPCPEVNAGIYDTSSVDPWCSWTSAYSRFNLYDAVLAVRLCHVASREFDSIGVTAPYKAQVRLIRALVDSDPFLKKKVTVANVHRFQGMEKDVMIVDLVDSTGLPIGRLLKGGLNPDDHITSSGGRILNVAISRGRKKLAIIANLAFLSSRLDQSWPLHKLLFTDSLALPRFQSEQLVGGYADAGVWQAREVVSPYGGLATPLADSLWSDAEFHARLVRDMQGAKRFIIIMSPFVTRYRLQTYIDLIRIKAEQGTRILLVVRPPSQQNADDQHTVQELLDHLSAAGVEVEQRRSMHQKVAIIDGEIIWFGSLNVLSHRNSQELMVRLNNARFAKQVMDECRLPEHGQGHETIYPLDLSGVPAANCSKCGKPMTLVPKGRFGPFHKCAGCRLTSSVRVADLRLKDDSKTCPRCGRGLAIRRSQKGMFIGCSGFGDRQEPCKYTRSL